MSLEAHLSPPTNSTGKVMAEVVDMMMVAEKREKVAEMVGGDDRDDDVKGGVGEGRVVSCAWNGGGDEAGDGDREGGGDSGICRGEEGGGDGGGEGGRDGSGDCRGDGRSMSSLRRR
ncbi:loricrin-like [Macadamia integrifolia]|uniref:loricrin-like n=1 Tax=Macadamia integrifolia TaxID=60698 RepID=UPI001C4FAF11|nr:loricrin-like [Macadamia integrifolia]